jgi:hypothetical protein
MSNKIGVDDLFRNDWITVFVLNRSIVETRITFIDCIPMPLVRKLMYNSVG